MKGSETSRDFTVGAELAKGEISDRLYHAGYRSLMRGNNEDNVSVKFERTSISQAAKRAIVAIVVAKVAKVANTTKVAKVLYSQTTSLLSIVINIQLGPT